MESYGPADTTVGRIEDYRQQSRETSLHQGLPFCFIILADMNDQVLAIHRKCLCLEVQTNVQKF